MSLIFLQDGLTKEEIRIDASVHSRLIGSRGRNIRRIMDEFKVDIKIPRKDDPDLELVTIIGPEENVNEAKEHLLQLEEEFVSPLFPILLKRSTVMF